MSGHQTAGAPAPQAKRQRATPIQRACDGCKKMKRRCSGGIPCEQCVRKKIAASCHYSEPRRRGPKKGWAERLKKVRGLSAACTPTWCSNLQLDRMHTCPNRRLGQRYQRERQTKHLSLAVFALRQTVSAQLRELDETRLWAAPSLV